MIAAVWYDSPHHANRLRALTLETDGTLFESHRDALGDVWSPPVALGGTFTFDLADAAAREAGLVLIEHHRNVTAGLPVLTPAGRAFAEKTRAGSIVAQIALNPEGDGEGDWPASYIRTAIEACNAKGAAVVAAEAAAEILPLSPADRDEFSTGLGELDGAGS